MTYQERLKLISLVNNKKKNNTEKKKKKETSKEILESLEGQERCKKGENKLHLHSLEIGQEQCILIAPRETEGW